MQDLSFLHEEHRARSPREVKVLEESLGESAVKIFVQPVTVTLDQVALPKEAMTLVLIALIISIGLWTVELLIIGWLVNLIQL